MKSEISPTSYLRDLPAREHPTPVFEDRRETDEWNTPTPTPKKPSVEDGWGTLHDKPGIGLRGQSRGSKVTVGNESRGEHGGWSFSDEDQTVRASACARRRTVDGRLQHAAWHSGQSRAAAAC